MPEGKRAVSTPTRTTEPSAATSPVMRTPLAAKHNESDIERTPEVSESSLGQPAQLDRWNALTRCGPELKAADEKIRPLGKECIERPAKDYFSTNDKASLPEIIERIVHAGTLSIQDSNKSPAEKWRVLSLYEPALREAESKVAALGDNWVSRLVQDYILINDKSYLDRIVDSILKDERRSRGGFSKPVETGNTAVWGGYWGVAMSSACEPPQIKENVGGGCSHARTCLSI